MFRYSYYKPRAIPEVLESMAQAVGLSPAQTGMDGAYIVFRFVTALSNEDETKLAQVVASYEPRRPKSADGIMEAINGLSQEDRNKLRQIAVNWASKHEDTGLRSRASLAVSGTLQASERATQADLLIVEGLKQHPKKAREEGIPIDGDEPDV